MKIKDADRQSPETRIAPDILDCISDAIATVDKDSRILYVNRGYELLFGTSRDEVTGESIWDGPSASFGAKFLMYYERALSDSAPIRFEHYIRGFNKTFDVQFYPAHGYLTMILHDTSAQWHTEDLYKLALFLLDRLDQNVFIIGSDGRLHYVNNMVCQLLGYSRDELIYREIFDIDAGIRADGWKDYFNNIKEGGSSVLESTLKAKNGELFPVEICANYVRLEDNGYCCATVINKNDMQNTIEPLHFCESDLLKSQQMAHLGSCDWDMASNRVYCSPEFYRILGMAPREYIDFEMLMNAVHRDDRELVRKANLDAAYKGAPYDVNFRIIRPDGAERNIHSKGEIVLGEDGKPAKLYEYIQDITEQMQVRLDLQKEKERLQIYNDLLEHDINNLNQIGIGYLELAISKMGVNEEGKRLLSRPLEAMINSSKLIENVQKLQSIEAGMISHEAVDVNEVLLDVVDAYSYVKDWSMEIVYYPVSGHCVMANELLRDVFSNIIGNSIKHSSGPLQINIAVSSVIEDGKKYCSVSVEDDGPGIADDIKCKLFGRLQRGNTMASGKGLGLFIVKTLVDDYRGKLWVEDRVQGDYTKGCRFVVMLPAVDA